MVHIAYSHSRKSYEAIRADKRPTIYKTNFVVFSAMPRSITGYQNDPPSTDATGYQNDIPTGYQNDGHGVSPGIPNPPLSSDPSDLRLTDASASSKHLASPEETNPPPRAGVGSGLSDPASSISLAPPTQ